MGAKPDLDSTLARVQFLTVIEMTCLASGAVAAIVLDSFWPALFGLSATFLISRLASRRITREAEDRATKELSKN